jgi:hypothetical protein
VDIINAEERLKELLVEANTLHQTTPEAGERIAKCARIAGELMDNDTRLPDWYLGAQWHGVMSTLPQCASSYEDAKLAFKCLKSIAFCMRDSLTKEHAVFYQVADELETSVNRLYEIDQEMTSLTKLLNSNTGGTLQ